ncbi:MAG: hypothetical protein HC770_10565 [Pseudanabaena sp. CRU_2_10]|nr:hypothetical protein [Pseudanabaena sp. CRU_2_10]
MILARSTVAIAVDLNYTTIDNDVLRESKVMARVFTGKVVIPGNKMDEYFCCSLRRQRWQESLLKIP